MTKPARSSTAILKTLAAHEVDSIVVDGVCAVLHGAPIATFDLDLVHSRETKNVQRLATALQELDARFREGSRQLIPAAAHLASPGHLLLLTRHGPLDLLGTIGKGRGYPELIGFSEVRLIGSLPLRVLGLEKLIEMKEEAGREKDIAVLPILRRTLEEKRKQ